MVKKGEKESVRVLYSLYLTNKDRNCRAELREELLKIIDEAIKVSDKILYCVLVVENPYRLKVNRNDKDIISLKKHRQSFFSALKCDEIKLGTIEIILTPGSSTSFEVLALKTAVENLLLRYLIQKEHWQKQLDIINLLETLLKKSRSETWRHCRGVRDYASFLAKIIGLSNEEVFIIEQAALIHDIGDIYVPEYIIKAPRKLTDEELVIIRNKNAKGAELLTEYGLSNIADIILQISENWDGTGYPYGLKNASIPLASRIIAIADRFDSCMNKRSYRPSLEIHSAIRIFKAEAGKRYDPTLTSYFVKMLESGKIKVFSSIPIKSQHVVNGD